MINFLSILLSFKVSLFLRAIGLISSIAICFSLWGYMLLLLLNIFGIYLLEDISSWVVTLALTNHLFGCTYCFFYSMEVALG